LQTVWDHLSKEKDKVESVEGVSVNAADLLPADHGYYTFDGSLTTPPCTEGVTWFVLKTPEEISSGEVETFARLYPNDTRPTQKLEGRVIRESK
jgi:carbonic anhydrase